MRTWAAGTPASTKAAARPGRSSPISDGFSAAAGATDGRAARISGPASMAEMALMVPPPIMPAGKRERPPLPPMRASSEGDGRTDDMVRRGGERYLQTSCILLVAAVTPESE